MSTRRSTARPMRSARWRELALAGAISGTIGACAPVTRAPPLRFDGPPTVRVGIVVDTVQVEVGATTDFAIVDAGTGRRLARLPPDRVASVRADPAGGLLVRADTAEQRVDGPVDVTPVDAGFVLIAGRPYRGVARVQPTGLGTVTAVNRVDMESYLLGVVPYEIGRVGPELHEAASAQAVAARTYAIRYLGRRDTLGFDVFATVEDQVYGGAEGEHEPVTTAVRRTAGEILTYGGVPIEAYYHSTCAGRTAAIEEVWPEEPRPYLRSVVDVDPTTGVAYDATSSRFRWTQRWSADELRGILDRTLADSVPSGASGVGDLLNLEILARTPSGRIRTLRITTSVGTFDVGGDRIRWIFLTPDDRVLNSSKFDVRLERNVRGEITEVVAEGMGWGHGIGMCQVGAMGRARAGQDYRRILRTYYPGARITRAY